MRTLISVPEAVREIITRNRSIYDCMKMDVINYTALAIKIQADIEKHVGSKVNLNTIVVAIKRYADSFEDKMRVKEESALKNARLSLTDGILDIRFRADDFEGDPTELLEEFSKISSEYEFFRLTDSFRFLAEDIEGVRRLFESLPNGKNLLNGGLAKIKINVPVDQSRSDIVSYIAEILHRSGIEMINAFFSQDSIVLILREEDASRAYDILRSDITR